MSEKSKERKPKKNIFPRLVSYKRYHPSNLPYMEVEVILSSQEARWLQKSARHLPIIISQCFNKCWKFSPDHVLAFDRIFMEEILKPLEDDLQKEAERHKLLCAEYGVKMETAKKKSPICKKLEITHPNGRLLVNLIKDLDMVIGQAEFLCAAKIIAETDYKDLRRQWRRKILTIGREIKELVNSADTICNKMCKP